jgi:hypothetical protein
VDNDGEPKAERTTHLGGTTWRSDHTTLVVLAVSLVLVVSIFAIHYRQEMTYWEELEGAVREERAARLDALAAVTAVQETASQKVSSHRIHVPLRSGFDGVCSSHH